MADGPSHPAPPASAGAGAGTERKEVIRMANPLVDLVDEESWNVLLETQPTLAETVKLLILSGEQPKVIAKTVRQSGGTPFLVNLVESAASWLAKGSN